jgi:hypothetical protein
MKGQKTNPSKLFTAEIFDGNKLLETPITQAWAAAYTVYGPGWIQEKAVFEIGTERKPPTKLAQTCKPEEIDKAKPFKSNEVFEDNPESLHNLEVTMKRLLHVRAKGKEVIQPSIWAEAMSKKLQHPKVKQVCIRLAKTPVTMFCDLNFFANNELDQMSVTSIWMGAHQSLGNLGPGSTAPQEVATAKETFPTNMYTKATKGIKFTEDTKPAAKPKPQPRLFITKERPKETPNTL